MNLNITVSEVGTKLEGMSCRHCPGEMLITLGFDAAARNINLLTIMK